jgi:phosphatidylinositol alpha-1,6-mannosyltransferase
VQRFPVVRHPGTLMLPVPDVLRRARAVARAEGCDRVWFGAAAPLGLLARPLGLERSVASTHGTRSAGRCCPARVRCCGASAATSTSSPTSATTRAGASPRRSGRGPCSRSCPAASTPTSSTRRPGATRCAGGTGLAGRPVVVCVSRLVPRKGQDVLVRGLPGCAAGCQAPPCSWSAAALISTGCAAWRPTPGWPTPSCSPARCLGGAARALRRRRRVRHALPDPPGRARGGGPRHRVPGGVGDRAAGGRRAVRRRAGRGAGGRDRPRGRRHVGGGRGGAVGALLADPERARAMGRAAAPGCRSSGAGTCWPSACAACSPATRPEATPAPLRDDGRCR